MAQRENPTIESAGLGAMAWMAQREDPTPESLAGNGWPSARIQQKSARLGVMATDGPARGSNP